MENPGDAESEKATVSDTIFGTNMRDSSEGDRLIQTGLYEVKRILMEVSSHQSKRMEMLELSIDGICTNVEHFSHKLKTTVDLVEQLDTKLLLIDDVMVKLANLEDMVSNLCSHQVAASVPSRGRRAAPPRGRGRLSGNRVSNANFAAHNTVIMVPTDDEQDSESIGNEIPAGVVRRTVHPSSSGKPRGSPIGATQQKKSLNAFNPSAVSGLGKNPSGSTSLHTSHRSHGLVTRFSLKQIPVNRPLKIQKIDLTKSESSKLSSSTEDTTQANRGVSVRSPLPETSTLHGLTMPAYIKCKFRPTVDMELSADKIQLCAYVWHVGDDDSRNEILIKTDEYEATRKSFDCFFLPQKITQEILTWMAIKATWTQQHGGEQTLWSLPPTFAVDVTKPLTIEEMKEKYVTKWIWPFPDLTHIYVPIEEKSGHWYLMVVCTEDKVIYQFDSNLDVDMIEYRNETMQKVCEVISQMFTAPEFPDNYLNGVFQEDNWELTEARGIANRGHSKDAAACVMEWLDMEQLFKANVSGMKHERLTRMRVAMDLLTGSHNELWPILQKKVEDFWLTVRNR